MYCSGFCRSKQTPKAAKLLEDKPNLTDKYIDDAMTHICRCGDYLRNRAAPRLVVKMRRLDATEWLTTYCPTAIFATIHHQQRGPKSST